MDYDWKKNHLETISIKKSKKTVKIEAKMPHLNKKTTSENANFCSYAVFSLYLKIRMQKVLVSQPLAFSINFLPFLFRRGQNHRFNLTSKFMKMCEQILRKRQCPNTIQNL